jgi:4-carboxymuconolactone decarboxylase
MTTSAQLAAFRSRINGFAPEKHLVSRWLSLYAAGIATADTGIQTVLLEQGRKHAIERQLFYEIILQSYLLPVGTKPASPEPPTGNEIAGWFVNGMSLCKKVYGENFDPLRARVEAMAPEIFRWMIIEGYGKVLSRPGLGVVERELANVAMLLAENREQQLHSHLRGALNVGATPDLLKLVVDDLADFTEGQDTARQLLVRMKVI